MTKYSNSLPNNLETWFFEITQAYADAKETISISELTGVKMTEKDLYHLGPVVCLKFRGIKTSDRILKQATESALSSYIATTDADSKILSDPFMAFAFCYLCSHFGLDIINEDQFNTIMDYVEKKIGTE